MGGNNRNFLIFVGLSIAILVVWQIFVAQPQIENARQAAGTEVIVTETPPAPPALAQDIPQAAGAAPVAGVVTDVAVVQALQRQLGSVCPAGATNQAALATARNAAIAATPRVPIASPAVTGSINLVGGWVDDLRLTEYTCEVEASPTIILLSPETAPFGYYADFGWVSSVAGVALPDRSTIWTAPEGGVLTPETPLTLTWRSDAGLVFTRTIAIDDHYLFTVTDSVRNAGAAPAQLTPYGRVTRLGEPTATGFFILHEGMIGVVGDQGLQELDYTAVADEQRIFEPADSGWLGMTDKYWAAVLIPDIGSRYSGRFTQFNDARGLRYQADFTGEARTVAAGETSSVTHRLFAGAKRVDLINEYRSTLQIDRFDLLIDWGWFYFITKPMFTAIDWLYRLVGNFGVAILLVTVLIKLVFFPLANRSYRSMAAMRKVTPQISALRERYRDDRPKQQQAMLELYRKEKINPVAGCWPILIQIPVFFALYKVLFVTIEMRHAPFFGWIQDLSVMDPIYVWPVIMGITMWVQFQLNPQAPGTPRWIFHILPLVFTFMLSSFPAGLVIYWAWNNLLSILQQSVIMKRNGVNVDLFGNIREAFKRKPKKADVKAKS